MIAHQVGVRGSTEVLGVSQDLAGLVMTHICTFIPTETGVLGILVVRQKGFARYPVFTPKFFKQAKK